MAWAIYHPVANPPLTAVVKVFSSVLTVCVAVIGTNQTSTATKTVPFGSALTIQPLIPTHRSVAKCRLTTFVTAHLILRSVTHRTCAQELRIHAPQRVAAKQVAYAQVSHALTQTSLSKSRTTTSVTALVATRVNAVKQQPNVMNTLMTMPQNHRRHARGTLLCGKLVRIAKVPAGLPVMLRHAVKQKPHVIPSHHAAGMHRRTWAAV